MEVMDSNSNAFRIPRTKVCGVTREIDLNVLARAGVEAVGINLVTSSPRCVDMARAKELCARAAELGLLRVAVMMNPKPQELAATLASIEFDFIQLHGEERPDLLAAIAKESQMIESQMIESRIIKAVSWSGRDAELQLASAWSESEYLGAWLVDAFAPGQGGGSGKQARWDLLLPRPPVLAAHPVILAGGLRPDNVVRAIQATRPHGVDTASGVETRPGLKDAELVVKFASNALAAFETADW